MKNKEDNNPLIIFAPILILLLLLIVILSLPSNIAKKFCEYKEMEYYNGFFINEQCLGEKYKYVEGRETKYIFIGTDKVCFDDGLIFNPILSDCIEKKELRERMQNE